jgi:hypothetical protein
MTLGRASFGVSGPFSYAILADGVRVSRVKSRR